MILPVPLPSPETFKLLLADHEYVIPVMPFDTSVSSNTMDNATSELVVDVPDIPAGPDGLLS